VKNAIKRLFFLYVRFVEGIQKNYITATSAEILRQINASMEKQNHTKPKA